MMRRIDTKKIPESTKEIRLFIVGVDAAHFIPHLCKHYFDIGVDRIFYVDNNSSDNSLEILSSYESVHTWSWDGQFSAKEGMRLRKELMDMYGVDNWCLLADTDELFIYPDYENLSLQEFVTKLEQSGADSAEARMIDMYSKDKIKDTVINKSLIETCPYFDKSEFGCRHRKLGFRPHIRKQPLIRYKKSMTIMPGFHAVYGCKKIYQDTCGILHFKFTSHLLKYTDLHGSKMVNSPIKNVIYSSVADICFYDKEYSIRFSGSKDLKYFPNFCSSKIEKLMYKNSDVLDWKKYLKHYPYLQKKGINSQQKATEHWIHHGQLEGKAFFVKKFLNFGLGLKFSRVTLTRFPQEELLKLHKLDWKKYLERYPRLLKAGVNTRQRAIAYWVTTGAREERGFIQKSFWKMPKFSLPKRKKLSNAVHKKDIALEDIEVSLHSVTSIDVKKETCVVIIGCYNGFKHTKELISNFTNSIDSTYNYIFYFFDDHSPELDTLKFFQQNIKTLDINTRFFRYTKNKKLTWTWNNGVNYGLKEDSAAYFIFLNNDTTVLPNWSKKMINFSKTKRDMCAIGAVSNQAPTYTGKQKIEYYLCDAASSNKEDARSMAKILEQYPPQLIDRKDFLNGFCFLLSKKVLNASFFREEPTYVYYFNPAYPHYGNETSFFLEFKYPKYVLPSVYVYHEKHVATNSYRSNFSFLYDNGALREELVICLFRYFAAIARQDSLVSSQYLLIITNYANSIGCHEVIELLNNDPSELEADIKMLKRQCTIEVQKHKRQA